MSDNFGPSDFATTRWSVVLGSKQNMDRQIQQDSLSKLCEAYWFPLFVYLRRKGHTANESADYVQGFFLELIDKEFLTSVAQERGRFRWFLKSAISRFVSKQIAHDNAQKRGGNVQRFSIDVDNAEQRYMLEPSEGWTAEKLFDRRWAIEVLKQALEELSDKYEKKGKSELFAALQHSLMVEEMEGPTYVQIAQKLSTSEGAIKVAAHRMKSEYRKLLIQIVSETLSDSSQVDQEMSELMSAFRGTQVT